MIFVLSPGPGDINWFLPFSPTATENRLDRAKTIQNLRRRLAPLMFMIRFLAFRDPVAGELPHVQMFMNDDPNPIN
jgi:hypothetical protein